MGTDTFNNRLPVYQLTLPRIARRQFTFDVRDRVLSVRQIIFESADENESKRLPETVAGASMLSVHVSLYAVRVAEHSSHQGLTRPPARRHLPPSLPPSLSLMLVQKLPSGCEPALPTPIHPPI